MTKIVDQELAVGGRVYKIIEWAGSSNTSAENAVNSAIFKPAGTVHNLPWFQIEHTPRSIEGNSSANRQAEAKIGVKDG